MSHYWNQKHVVVTGGSSGFGLQLAKQFHFVGAKLTIVGRNPANLDAAVKLIGGENVTHFVADVTNDQDVSSLFEHIREQPLHAFVNAVGKSDRQRVLDTTVDDFQQSLELNFLSTVRCSRHAVPMLLENKGHLINIGSLASKSASRFLGAYPASKFPLAAYSQQLRLELADQGLHVLLVCPGPIQRDDAGSRYDQKAINLPPEVRKPGGGVQVRAIDPRELSRRILRACEKRIPELIIPQKAKLLFAISALFPRLGDWILRKKT